MHAHEQVTTSPSSSCGMEVWWHHRPSRGQRREVVGMTPILSCFFCMIATRFWVRNLYCVNALDTSFPIGIYDFIHLRFLTGETHFFIFLQITKLFWNRFFFRTYLVTNRKCTQYTDKFEKPVMSAFEGYLASAVILQNQRWVLFRNAYNLSLMHGWCWREIHRYMQIWLFPACSCVQ